MRNLATAIVLLAAWVGPSGAGAQVIPPGASQPAPASPVVDHHLHLISPEVAAVINGPALPQVEPPAEVSALLRARALHWNDAAALGGLYTQDAVVLIQEDPKAGLFRGPEVAARFLSGRFAAPYRLTPVAYAIGGEVAHVTGYYSRGEGPQTRRIGYFQLGLAKAADGGWRIKAETPSFPSRPAQEPVTAEEMVAALDAAGIRRGVVLSGAVAIGGRWLDIYHQQGTPAERGRRVRAENQWTADQVRRFRDRLVAFCSLNPLEPYAPAELQWCAKSGAFAGLKLHLDESAVDLRDPAHVAKLRGVFAQADALRLPIVVHVGNNEGDQGAVRANVGTLLDAIAAAAPNISIQIAHLWGGGGYSEAALTAYADAFSSGHPATRNLYFDMSEAPLVAAQYGDRKAQILQTVAARMRRIGLERILFGSDASGKGHLKPDAAWREFRTQVPLSEQEFGIIASNVAPYLR